MEDFEHGPPRKSALLMFVETIGVPTLTLIVLATLIAIALVVLLFVRGRGPAVPAAILFVLPLPLLVGLTALVIGTISYYRYIAERDTYTSEMPGLLYGFISIGQASGCFCPLLILSLVFLMVLGFRGRQSGL